MQRCGLIVILLVPLLAGCDLFNTREPETPDSGRSCWEIPLVPGDVLDNLACTFAERSAVNYLLSFDRESFDFVADPEALSQDPSLAEWGYDAESSHISLLFSEGTLPRDSSLAVVFLTSSSTTQGDSAEIIADYTLTAEIALSGAPGPMAGTAHFFLRVGEQGYWEIYRWRDSRTEEQNTWSDLKSLVH